MSILPKWTYTEKDSYNCTVQKSWEPYGRYDAQLFDAYVTKNANSSLTLELKGDSINSFLVWFNQKSSLTNVTTFSNDGNHTYTYFPKKDPYGYEEKYKIKRYTDISKFLYSGYIIELEKQAYIYEIQAETCSNEEFIDELRDTFFWFMIVSVNYILLLWPGRTKDKSYLMLLLEFLAAEFSFFWVL